MEGSLFLTFSVLHYFYITFTFWISLNLAKKGFKMSKCKKNGIYTGGCAEGGEDVEKKVRSIIKEYYYFFTF